MTITSASTTTMKMLILRRLPRMAPPRNYISERKKMCELEDPEHPEQAQCPEYKQRLRTSQPEREILNFQCSMMSGFVSESLP